MRLVDETEMAIISELALSAWCRVLLRVCAFGIGDGQSSLLNGMRQPVAVCPVRGAGN